MRRIVHKMIQEYTVAILLMILAGIFSYSVNGFATWSNFFNLLRQVSMLGIVSSGMAVVIITGNIDLSVGSMISLISCTVAIMIGQRGVPAGLACCLGILMCTVLMLCNGMIIVYTGMPAMLCTLALMYIYKGITYIITNATPVYGLPETMRMLGQGYISVVPIPVMIMLLCFIVSGIFLSQTYIGRYFYAVGSNMEAARLTGVPVVKTKLAAYAFCGIMVGIATLVQTSRLFGGFPAAGDGLEMDVIIAVIVGGVSFAGGKGRISGVVQGVLLMGVLTNGLGVMGAGTYMQLVVKGVVLIVVVGLDYIRRKE